MGLQVRKNVTKLYEIGKREKEIREERVGKARFR